MSNTLIKRKEMVFSIEDIKARLPHRYPFLMVDRIVKQLPSECIGIKNVTFNEPYFMGHFPAQSIMPGILIAEAMIQTAAFIEPPSGVEGFKMKQIFLTSVNVKIHKPVIPGDQLIIKVKVIKTLGELTKFSGEVSVEGEIVASGEFNVAEVK